ncbi:MAG: prepilin-type N-terminal cleavage/methylation domain-containing protein [Burkholderiaceae bacterium]
MAALSHRRGERGFTLLELLVVIVLAGILLTVVTINVMPDAAQRLDREAERVGQLMALAADESRLSAQPISWEADLAGYRFVTERGGERRLITGDDLLRERRWDEPLTRLAVVPAQGEPQVLLGAGAPALRVPIAREWVQPRWRLELATATHASTVEFDDAGRAHLAAR